MPPDVDPDTYARSRAGAGRAGGGGRVREDTWDTGAGQFDVEGIDLDDLLGGVFGGRTRRGWGRIPGSDQEVELELTVEEAYRGGNRKLTVRGPAGDDRTIDVKIPAGVMNGQRIRLGAQGGQGTGGAPAGDLYLVVRIADHPRYRVVWS